MSDESMLATEIEAGNDKKEYEISFMLSEEGVALEIDGAIKAVGGEITTPSSVAMIRLAYPIKKQENAYFGFIHFKVMPEGIAKLKDALSLNTKILRFLIITPPVKVVTRDAAMGPRAPRPKSDAVAPKPEAAPAETPILSNEGLEKKLEEILK